MKIEGSSKLAATLLLTDNRIRGQVNATKPSAQVDAKVEISSLSSSLGRAEMAMAATPTVDRAKVEELRQAISEGRFKVDASRVADGLIASVRNMLESNSGL